VVWASDASQGPFIRVSRDGGDRFLEFYVSTFSNSAPPKRWEKWLLAEHIHPPLCLFGDL